MRFLIPLLLLFVLSCEEHIPNPPVLSLQLASSEFLRLEKDNSYWTKESYRQDSIQISLTVRTESHYLFTLNGIDTVVALKEGFNRVAFSWKSFPIEKRITVTVADERVPQDGVTASAAIKNVADIDPATEPFLRYAWQLVTPDPVFAERWNIDSAANIHVKSVWETNKGEGIKVAIIDDGFQPFHEDLVENVINTWDAESQTTIFPTSYGYHGTAVAGVVGAVKNGVGICGVAPKASLILIRINVDAANDAEIIRAFTYAKSNGARVINCSWGTYHVSEAVEAIIQEMHDDGIVVVFAAGNYHEDFDDSRYNDESELPTVIGVGGSTQRNDYWNGSSYGSNLDILAPGGDIGYPGVLVLDGMGLTSQTRDVLTSSYRFWEGCSFASPAIAGVAALVLAENPSLTPDLVRSILIHSADKVASIYSDNPANYNQNGFDKYRFYGKVNVEKAIALAKQM